MCSSYTSGRPQVDSRTQTNSPKRSVTLHAARQRVTGLSVPSGSTRTCNITGLSVYMGHWKRNDSTADRRVDHITDGENGDGNAIKSSSLAFIARRCQTLVLQTTSKPTFLRVPHCNVYESLKVSSRIPESLPHITDTYAVSLSLELLIQIDTSEFQSTTHSNRRKNLYSPSGFQPKIENLIL